MGYELNTNAYRLFIQIEVGIREFLINLIRQKGVNEWYNNFLGQFQRDAINVVLIRISEAQKKHTYPSIEDQFRYKLNRALKESETGLKCSDLYHPFYYLNWTDMEMILNKKNNTDLIDNSIGKKNREVIVNNLKLLNELRNHIAHSRFITEEGFKIATSAFEQISSVIPDFKNYYNNQSKEDKFGVLLNNLNTYIEKISSTSMISLNEIDVFLKCISNCLNSLWLNSIYPDIIKDIIELNSEIEIYKSYRNSPGGLLKILNWKDKNSKFIDNIKTKLTNGKV